MQLYRLNNESFYGGLTNTQKLSEKRALRLTQDCDYLREKNSSDIPTASSSFPEPEHNTLTGSPGKQ